MITEEIVSYLRCPGCAGERLVAGDGDARGIECRGCGTVFTADGGVLDLVPPASQSEARSDVDAAQAHYWEEEQEIYRAYDHVVARGFAEQRAEYVRSCFSLSELDSAVDVGAGNGMSTHVMEPSIRLVFSTDYSHSLLADNPARIRMRADAYCLPFRDKSVDLVYSWELLHHIERPCEVLVEMKRVARKYVMFFEPNRYNPAQLVFATLSKPNRSCLRNTRRFFIRQVREAGLNVLRYDSVGWLTPNIPPVWLYHILRRLPFRVPFIGISHFFLLGCD